MECIVEEISDKLQYHHSVKSPADNALKMENSYTSFWTIMYSK